MNANDNTTNDMNFVGETGPIVFFFEPGRILWNVPF